MSLNALSSISGLRVFVFILGIVFLGSAVTYGFYLLLQLGSGRLMLGVRLIRTASTAMRDISYTAMLPVVVCGALFLLGMYAYVVGEPFQLLGMFACVVGEPFQLLGVFVCVVGKPFHLLGMFANLVGEPLQLMGNACVCGRCALSADAAETAWKSAILAQNMRMTKLTCNSQDHQGWQCQWPRCQLTAHNCIHLSCQSSMLAIQCMKDNATHVCTVHKYIAAGA